MAYLKSFFIGGVTAGVSYMLIDYLDFGDYLAPGAQTAFVAGGIGAIAAPAVLSRMPFNMQG
jgi:hypothetical protein